MCTRVGASVLNTFYFCTVNPLFVNFLYQHLVEKLSLGNTSYPILEPHFVPGPFFSCCSLTGDFDKLGFAHASLATQTRRRECIRAAKRWTQMYCSDGQAAWAAVNRRKRKQCAAKECTSHSLLATQTRVMQVYSRSEAMDAHVLQRWTDMRGLQ